MEPFLGCFDSVTFLISILFGLARKVESLQAKKRKDLSRFFQINTILSATLFFYFTNRYISSLQWYTPKHPTHVLA